MTDTFDQQQWTRLADVSTWSKDECRVVSDAVGDIAVVARSRDPLSGLPIYSAGWSSYTTHTWGALVERIDWPLGLVAFVHDYRTGRRYDIEIASVSRASGGFDIKAQLRASDEAPQATYSAMPVDGSGELLTGTYGDVFVIEVRRFGNYAGSTHLVLIY